MATALDPDLVLELCKKCSGYDGVARLLAEEGLKNPRTKKPYSKHTVLYTVRKAEGYKAWRAKREEERRNTRAEFTRIAKRRLATMEKQKKAKKP